MANIEQLAKEIGQLTSDQIWELAICLIDNYKDSALLLKEDLDMVDNTSTELQEYQHGSSSEEVWMQWEQ